MKMTIKLPALKRRAIELYHRDSPFKPKVVKSKKAYCRRSKHANADFSH